MVVPESFGEAAAACIPIIQKSTEWGVRMGEHIGDNSLPIGGAALGAGLANHLKRDEEGRFADVIDAGLTGAHPGA